MDVHKQEQQHEQEIEALSEDLYSIEELEARLEMAAGVIDTLCSANYCGANGCNNNTNVGW